MNELSLMEKIQSLCKRRGFIFQGSELYGGLAGTFDYGPYGIELKNNVKQLWWKMFVQERDDMVGIDAAILMNPRVWESSGHVAGFADPLVEDLKTHKRYRADHLLEAAGIDVKGMTIDRMSETIKEKGIKSPDNNPLGEVRQFNMMFKTQIGANEDTSSISYLRPETAGGIFVNFKNVVDSLHPKLPFGIAQIGKAFRNEIAPRDYIFRLRELEQMEVEYFVRPDEWEQAFEEWRLAVHEFNNRVGIPKEKVYELEIAPEDRAHYSKRTIDFEFDFPFGRKELYGLAYRTDFDLSAHSKGSGQNLTITDGEGKPAVTPHVVEPSFGVDRTILAILTAAYTEDSLGGEVRTYLRLPKEIAPVKAAVFPLLKNKPVLVEKAREIYKNLKKHAQVEWDDNGNIGKRYRRQDEIGTPLCITVDFETLEGEHAGTVTVRDRDTGEQKRVPIERLTTML